MGVWDCERTIVCNITKSRMEQGSRCFALRIVISITSLPIKKGVPTRENHVPLTIVWCQVWVGGLLPGIYYFVRWSASFFLLAKWSLVWKSLRNTALEANQWPPKPLEANHWTPKPPETNQWQGYPQYSIDKPRFELLTSHYFRKGYYETLLWLCFVSTRICTFLVGL